MLKRSAFSFVLFLLLAFGMSIACVPQKSSSSKSSEFSDINDAPPQAQLYPIDFAFRSTDELVVLFTDDLAGLSEDLQGEIQSWIGTFHFDGTSWHPSETGWINEYSIDPEKGLAFPHTIQITQDGTYLISDTSNSRFLEIDRSAQILTRFDSGFYLNEAMVAIGPDGKKGILAGMINIKSGIPLVKLVSYDQKVLWQKLFPGHIQIHHAHQTGTGSILVCLKKYTAKGEIAVIQELSFSGDILWEYLSPTMNWPRNAVRLPNQNTIIAHQGLLEVQKNGDIEWEFKTDHFLYNVQYLPDTDTLVMVYQDEIVWMPRGCTDESCFSNRLSYRGPVSLPLAQALKAHPYMQ
jgi:hypothetical protein